MTKKRIIILLLVVVAITVSIVLYFSKPGTPNEASPEETVYNEEDHFWELASNLSALNSVTFPSPETFIEEELAEIKTPDDILDFVEGAVIVTPAAGSMLHPTDILSGGMSSTLDRALLIDWLLKKNGYPAQIMYTRYDANKARVTYPANTPRVSFPADTALIEMLETNFDRYTTAIHKQITGHANPGIENNYSNRSTEKNIYWVQYQNHGTWVNLVPSDTFIDSTVFSAAAVLTESDINNLRWTVQLKIINELPQEREAEVLTASFSASELHNVALTCFNRPGDSLSLFTPVLLYGNQSIEGTPFTIGETVFTGQHLLVEVSGPGEKRTFTRKLPELTTTANNIERGFETAALAKITILNGLISDDQFTYAITSDLQQASDILFNRQTAFKNTQSVSALAILEASQRYAGQAGKFGQRVFAYRGRPAIIIERDFVKTDPGGLKQYHTIDLVDPGHAIHSASADTAMMAAIEQSLTDGIFESWYGFRGDAITSQNEIEKIIQSGTPVTNVSSLTGTIISGENSPQQPVYFIAAAAGNTKQPGWRLDPGPQLVPVLADGSGGIIFLNKSMLRFEGNLCDKLGWLSMLIPMRVMPQEVLLNGLIKYHCRLAEAYNRAASVLDGLFDSNPDSTAKKIKELEDLIKNMGPELAKDIVRDALTGAAIGTAMRPVMRAANEAAPMLRSLGSGVAKSAREGAGALRNRVAKLASGVEKLTPETRRLNDLMQKQGMTEKQAKEFFEKFGCVSKGTLVQTPAGFTPIENINQGDVVFSYDMKTGALTERKVERTFRHSPPQCIRITLTSGNTIETTGTHLFFVLPDSNWVSASSLHSGSVILSTAAAPGKEIVKETIATTCSGYVYDLQVEKDHNYFITTTGLLVHNWDPAICTQNRKLIEKLLGEGKKWPEIVKQMKPHPEDLAKSFKGTAKSPVGTGKYKYDIHEQAKNWGYNDWGKRAKDPTQVKKVSEEIGEVGMHIEARKRGYTAVLPPNKASGFPQGFDGVYKDKDGTWVIGEAKGGYNRAGANTVLKEGYGHRQGTIGWVEGACKKVINSSSTSAAEKKVAGEILQAIHDGKPIRTELFHTKQSLGTPRSTAHYTLETYP